MFRNLFVLSGDVPSQPYTARPTHSREVRAELQDADGQPLEGLTLADCQPLLGDEIATTVTWNSGVTVRDYAGTPVRLRFQLKHTDVFSFRFAETSP